MNALELIGRNFPEEIKEKAKKLLEMTGSNANPYVFLSLLSIFLVLLFISSFLFFSSTGKGMIKELALSLSTTHTALVEVLLNIIFSTIITLTFLFLIISYYEMVADIRKNAIESILPDFLTLVSSNIRSGMTLEQALWQAAKPEFGVLAKEVKETIKASFSGEPVDKALDKLANKFNSDLLKRALEILKQSLYTGGEITKVLEKVSEEANQIILLRKEMKSNLIIYVIFLFFAAAIGIPFLLSVSYRMLIILTNTMSNIPSTPSMAGIALSPPPFTPKEFYFFSLIVIIISNITTAFLIGATYSGKKTDGIKYLPTMLILSFIVFFLADAILKGFFSTLG